VKELSVEEKLTGKGKMICRVGRVAVMLEKYPETIGPVFKFCIVDEEDNVLAEAGVDVAMAVFITRTVNAAIDICFEEALTEGWNGSKEPEG
jgi:hypothetical protein